MLNTENHSGHHRFLHLEAWSLELDIQQLPDTKEWISTFHAKHFPLKNCSEYFAVFEDEKTTLHLALILPNNEVLDKKRLNWSLSGTNGL